MECERVLRTERSRWATHERGKEGGLQSIISLPCAKFAREYSERCGGFVQCRISDWVEWVGGNG